MYYPCTTKTKELKPTDVSGLTQIKDDVPAVKVKTDNPPLDNTEESTCSPKQKADAGSGHVLNAREGVSTSGDCKMDEAEEQKEKEEMEAVAPKKCCGGC